AQRLEAARCRMLAGLAPADRLRNQVGQLAGTFERCLAAALDDRSRDPATVAFFAELPENVGDLGLIGASEKARGAFAVGRIHAHVERRVGLEAESSSGVIELRRRYAEVEQHSVQTVARRIPLDQIGEAAVAYGYAAIVAELGARDGYRRRIAVHQQQARVRTEAREHGTRVAAAAEGAVEVGAVVAQVQTGKRFFQHDRDVGRCGRHAVIAGHYRSGADRHATHKRRSSISLLRSASPIVWRILSRCACSLHSSNLRSMPSRTARFSMPAALRWLAGTSRRALPSSSTGAAAPTSFNCRSRCTRLTLDRLLTWSRTRSHS